MVVYSRLGLPVETELRLAGLVSAYLLTCVAQKPCRDFFVFQSAMVCNKGGAAGAERDGWAVACGVCGSFSESGSTSSCL